MYIQNIHQEVIYTWKENKISFIEYMMW